MFLAYAGFRALFLVSPSYIDFRNVDFLGTHAVETWFWDCLIGLFLLVVVLGLPRNLADT